MSDEELQGDGIVSESPTMRELSCVAVPNPDANRATSRYYQALRVPEKLQSFGERRASFLNEHAMIIPMLPCEGARFSPCRRQEFLHGTFAFAVWLRHTLISTAFRFALRMRFPGGARSRLGFSWRVDAASSRTPLFRASMASAIICALCPSPRVRDSDPTRFRRR